MSVSHAQASVAFLSGADDLLSRILLDYSIFEEPRLDGRATGKINRNLRELRMTEKEVDKAKALVRDLRSGSVSLTKGLETLLKFPCVDSFTKKWDDVPLFANHAKRYILAFRPDCGIAFHETDRYKNPRAGVTARAKKNLAAVTSRRDPASFIEVGVFATRDFKKGELVNLRGGIADLTEEEDDELRLSGGRSDFSVLWSERKNSFCLLLGPARFVNHDCRNNVEFNLVGSNMSFKVLEDIKKDEELFTHYGAHYFETDNAACLCATCEQLKQGAFTPANKRKKVEVDPSESGSPAPSRTRRNSSPDPGPQRSSFRASRLPAVNYSERKPVASTSATLVTKPTTLTRSTSVSSLKPRPRPLSSKRMPVRGALSEIDALRGKPRLVVQPKLTPPPGYSEHYEWDPKKRVAKYTGPHRCEDEQEKRVKKAKPIPAARSRSDSPPPAKRRRASTAPAPSPKPKEKKVKAPPTPRRVRPISQVEIRLAKARVGERKSGRLSVGSVAASGQDRTSSKTEETIDGEDSSDLSEDEANGEDEEKSGQSEAEAQDGDDAEKEEEEAIGVKRDKGKGKAVESEDVASPALAAPRHARSTRSVSSATRSNSAARSASIDSGSAHLRSVTLDLGFSTSTPVEEQPAMFAPSYDSQDEAMTENDKTKPRPIPDPEKDNPRPPDRPRRSISIPNFYANKRATEGAGGAGGSSNGKKNTNSGDSSFCEAPSSAVSSGRGSFSQAATRAPNGGGVNNGNGGAGSGGDDEDERNGRKREIPSDKMEVENSEDEEEEDRKPIIDEAVAVTVPRDDPEAIAALLLLQTIPDSESATPPSASNSSVESSSARVEKPASNIRRGKRRASVGDDDAQEAVPLCSSSRKTLDDGKRIEASTSASPRVKKARNESPPNSESSEEPVPRARSNIRWGKGKPGQRPPHIPPPSPGIPVQVSTAEPVPSPFFVQARAEQSSATERRAAARTRPQPAVATPPVVTTGRQTRSKPIPGRLEDVLSAPETLAATGGYDWEKGRYITKHEQLRAPSSNPRPERRETESPSPPPSPRRRRRTSTVAPTPAVVAPSPVASTSSAPPPAIQSRRSDSPVRLKPAARRRVTHSPVSSAAQVAAPSTAPPAAVPPEGRRATRRSFPIVGGLRDVIYSSSALAATGGWDEESGRYVGASSTPILDDSASSSASNSTPGPQSKKTSVKRSKSATPKLSAATLDPAALPPPLAPTSGTPDSATRSTRRSNPINQRLEQLVYSSAVGGWDPVKGKYVSQVAARKASSSQGGK